MIVKIKSDEIIKELEENITSCSGKKYEYSIVVDDLQRVLSIIYSKGIEKIKIIIKPEDEKVLKKYLKESDSKKTESGMEYLESILSKEVQELEKDKDIINFFKIIGFKDEHDIIKNIYDAIIAIPDSEVEELASLNHGQKTGIYPIACNKVYADKTHESGKKVDTIIKKSIKNWLDEYHPDYKKYIRKSIPYNIFIKFLLKHTGHNYY